KKASKVEVINDINGELINLYRVVKNHLEEFVRQFKWALSSRQIFDWQKATPTEVLTDIQRAARFYYLQNMAFGSKVEGQTFGTATTAPMGINLLRLEETLSIAHLRLARTTIENLSWVECIEKYDRPHTLFYLDPPYWGTQGYGVEFGLEQYEAIAHLARTIKGNMIISVNDIPEMRQAFSDLQIEVVSLKYSLGNSSLARCELIVRNFT
ncbi:putative DNA adenine methylase, partial [Serratia symbiotica str. Tucson]